MNKTKLYHYVPQFYLKNFQIPKGQNMIWCFDKVTSRTFKVDIRKIGCGKDFYDEDSEKYLSNLESQISPVCKKIVETRDLGKLNWTERVTMAKFVAIQDTRSQEGRIALQEVGEALIGRIVEVSPTLKQMINKGMVKGIRGIIRQKAAAMAKETQIGLLKQETELFAEMLLGLQWVLIENKTKMPLWASDNPVNKYNPIKALPYLGNLGYLCSGIEIFLPISPVLCLCLCDLGTHRLVPSEKLLMQSKQNVIYQNYFQLAQSSRHVFSQRNDFSLATKILKAQPYLSNPLRKRTISS
jgi:hypothetical protein